VHDLSVYIVYLFYGLVFFTMGVAITSKDTSSSQLHLARILPLLAIFAYTHAAHEWLELYLRARPTDLPHTALMQVLNIKLGCVTVSFIFLLAFGIGLLRTETSQKYLHFLPILGGVLFAAWLGTLVFRGLSMDRAFFEFADTRARNLLGFPGATLSGIGLILRSRHFYIGHGKGTRAFVGAGSSLILYGILTGLVPSSTNIPIIDMPIAALRGAVAFASLHFLMSALHIFDVEERQLMEDKLRRFARSEKLTAVGKLAAGIAHEINNPLSNVSLNIEMLRDELSQDNKKGTLMKRLDAIERNVDRASKIAGELLHFSREKDAELAPTDVNAVIRSTLTLVDSKRERITFRTELEEIPIIQGIPWKLEEVFLNLLLNAMESMSTEGTIILRTYEDKDCVVAQVIDSGTGISEENLNYIFDPFFTTKDVGEGTGLGLSICFGIMESHGGTIELTSLQAEGTTATIRLPVEGTQ